MGAVGIVACACAFEACIQIAWNTISVVTTERFPTVVRATAWSVVGSSGKVSGAIANYANGYLVSNPPILLLVASAFMVIAGITPFFLPTTTTNNNNYSSSNEQNHALKDDLELTDETQKGIEIS